MLWRGLVLLALAAASAGDSQERPTGSARRSANKVLDIDTSCNKESFEIRIRMELPFKGLVFAKDFSRECRAQGSTEKKISLYLPPNACGVRTASGGDGGAGVAEGGGDDGLVDAEADGLHYSVTLVVQMDRYLQQSSDQEVVVKCWLRPRAMRIRSDAVEETIRSKIVEMTRLDSKRSRTGRTRQDWLQQVPEEQREWLMEQARAWMELAPARAAEDAPAHTVEVGQPTTLLIKSTLPVGIGLRITDCLAHDGLGEASQKLLDDAGCPIDEMIFTKPTIHRHRPKGAEINVSDLENVDTEKNIDQTASRKLVRNEPEHLYKNIMVYQHATTTFGAFKFPDRSRLHLTCGIELCKGDCPVIDCKALQKPQKTKEGLLRRARLDKDAHGVVLERLEVYNSIEVLAPNIELEDEASIRGTRQHIQGDDLDAYSRSFSPGDKTVCMSPSKMALAFCILGLIFLCALVVAFVSLIRARRKYGHQRFQSPLSFYTGSKSMFSASTTSSSGLSGSKLLLTDSPFLDQQSSSSHNWPYARAF